MTPFLLWLLATLDAAFMGYREAAGRNALIHKRYCYLRAMIRGALLGQVVIAAVGFLILAAILSAREPASVVGDLLLAGSKMLLVYVPYAVVILLTFGIRAIPSVDLRSITSVVVFGPFTLIRPGIAAVGVIWGVYSAPSFINIVLGLAVLFLMLTMERMIGFLRSRALIA